MSGVIAQGDGRPIVRAQAAVRAEDQELFATQRFRGPPHAGVLRKAEKIAGWLFEQHFRGEGKGSERAASVRPDVEKFRIKCVDDAFKVHVSTLRQRASATLEFSNLHGQRRRIAEPAPSAGHLPRFV